MKLKANAKKIFEVLTKAAVMAAVGKYDSAIKEAVGLIAALGLKKETDQIGYEFILQALTLTTAELLKENEHQLSIELTEEPFLQEANKYVQFLNQLEAIALEYEPFTRTLQDKPTDTAIFRVYKEQLKNWLIVILKEPDGANRQAQATAITNRLKDYFIHQLHKVWVKNPDKYQVLLKQFKSPFDAALLRNLEQQAYNAYLQQQTAMSVFGEAFGLKDVFIPLRGYYHEKPKKDRYGNVTVEGKKKVIEVAEKMNQWLDYTHTKDEIKIISGGPGSGKSSFAKMWAAEVANTKRDWLVIFIPLHLFDIAGNLTEALGDFLTNSPHIPFTANPLTNPSPNQKILLLFDGLDELVMQGKTAKEAALAFMETLNSLCGRFNTKNNKTLLKIVVAGRPIAIQNSQLKLQGTKEQFIHLLPYYLTGGERYYYTDTNKLLAKDQRQTWWNQFHALKGNPSRRMPKVLQTEELDKITKEPLLNYLVALAWTFNPTRFETKININEIYQELIKGVYQRDYEKEAHKGVTGLSDEEFIQILEEIAVCAWHGGDVRVTSVAKIEQHLNRRNLSDLLENYKAASQGGVTRLLTAFYFRQYGKDETSKDDTFEFTHKSFGEYLTARAIVELLIQIHAEREDFKQNKNSRRAKGWTIETALLEWLHIMGQTAITNDLEKMIYRELQLRKVKKINIKALQACLCELIAYAANQGMPFMSTRLAPKEEHRIIRNAGEALLVILSNCATISNDISTIAWRNKLTFSEWMVTLSRSLSNYSKAFKSLKYLNLRGANLGGANLRGADLRRADLRRADLRETNLRGADLIKADLSRANLSRANLRGANLIEANLIRANLIGADLREADLRETNLRGADLIKADLSRANLSRANLRGANLIEANLIGADLREADLSRADLRDANLSRADLSKVDLSFKQLVNTYSLYQCKGIPEAMEQELRADYPNLFKYPY